RIERERWFLIDRLPDLTNVRARHITDLYIDETSLRLREVSESGQPTVYKLTQKTPERGPGTQQGFITNLYITAEELQLLAELAAKKLSKTRYSFPPFGIDVFHGALEGLCLAETEFDSAKAADALTTPPFILTEVTEDQRFTGGARQLLAP